MTPTPIRRRGPHGSGARNPRVAAGHERRWVAAALALFALGLGSRDATAVSDPTCGAFPLVQRSDMVQYELPRTFLRAGTDSVRSSSRALRAGQDYSLDPTRGILRLLGEPVPGETLWVSVCWLAEPPPLGLQLNAYRPPFASADSAASDSARLQGALANLRPITARSPNEAPSGTSLVLSGNKTIAVDFGSSQDAFLRQSLDLGVTGTLAPGVELTGVLSDRNTPLTASGATQDLQSIDRLLIELRAPQGGAALGDVALSLQGGEFARLDRRLQGVRGEWGEGALHGVVAAASAQGEYHRMEFFGVEGRQGPYELTDRNGATPVSVVAGSEIVVVDGERLTRGESADYAIDYDRGRITFSNRRPITQSSRITIDYQFSLNRFRRNLAAASARWEGAGWHGFTTWLTESDDRGRPLAAALDASDRVALAAAGDSGAVALGPGVVAGSGDYDLAPDSSSFVFAGPDSGQYSVRFARVGPGVGDYVEAGVVQGRTTYRYVGPGQGDYRVGRLLPLPDSHQLWAAGGGWKRGVLGLEVEGGLSRLDMNTFSTLDDADNVGRAGSAKLTLAGGMPHWLGGTAGLEARARTVDRRFQPFTRLEAPFSQEDWGLPPGTDLDHQTRTEVSGFLRPRMGGELTGAVGRLETATGFQAWRRSLEWREEGVLSTHARWERSDGEQAGMRFAQGGRDHRIGEIGLSLPWLEPRLRADWDERRTPGDTVQYGARSRELSAELRSPRTLTWQSFVGYAVRRDGRLEGASFVDQSEARTARLGLETPAAAVNGAALTLQHRVVEPQGEGARSQSDLASLRLRASDLSRGLSGNLNVEATSEGENERTRELRFVGAGLGGYDSLGNFVGKGDYDLQLTVSAALRRVARAATSARAAWQFGSSDVWRGSRLELSLETEARRRGELSTLDAVLTPHAALRDAELSRGAVTQRVEAEIAPGSKLSALRVRLERRVNADRSFENFAQALDERSATSRWQARPAPAWSTEIEGRWKRQEASQAFALGAGFHRVLLENGVGGRVTFAPDARHRVAAVADAAWSRPAPSSATPFELTRTVRCGPEVGLGVGAQGRLELAATRAFVSGPEALSLLPTAEPAGAPRWQGSARFDYRLRESTTVGLTWTLVDRVGRPAQHTGRAEVRAFF